jgi:hypothetical protein
MTNPTTKTVEAQLAKFDRLPDDAVVGDPVVAALMNMSPETFRRSTELHKLMPRKQFSKRRGGRRVGDIRAVIRGAAA